MNVFQWAADDGGSWWYRLHVPGAALRRVGYTVRDHQRALMSWVLDADVVVGARVTNPGPSQLWQDWARLGKRLVYDVDDDMSVIDPASKQAYAFYSNPEVQSRIGENMRAAAVVTCASERIADWASRYTDRVVVVPNGIPADVLSWQREPQGDGRLVVGWVGSTQSLPELALVVKPLLRLLDTHRRVEVHTVGIPRVHIEAAGLVHERVRCTEWTPPGEAYLRLVDFDVWVAPYRDIPFNQAKYPTKRLEAAFLGVPLVCSGVGEYRDLDSGCGFVVRAEHEWGRYLQRLVTDVDLRHQMSRAARQSAVPWIAEGYAPRWEKALAAG